MLSDEKYEFERRLKLTGVYTHEDLKHAYRRATKACHPDIARFHGVPIELAEESMKRVNEAHDALERLFTEWPGVESITSDYNSEGDQIDNGFYIFDDEVYLGAYIQFGRYPLDKDRSFQPLIWYVIDLTDEYATLITEQCIDCRPYHSRRGPVDWAKSDLRIWLNTVFFERAFSSEEAAVITNVELNNATTNEYGIFGGPNTVDKVYLIGVDEAENLFANWRDLSTTATEFASERGSFRNEEDQTFWWLRSPGRVSDAVAYIAPDGYIHSYDGRSAVSEGYSVRPAVRIRLRRHSHDHIERDTERARRKTAAEKEKSEQAARDRATREAEAQAARAQAEAETIEEERAKTAGFTPFSDTPASGSVIAFGRYPDGNEIKWRVLRVFSNSALLITDELVAKRPFSYDVTQSQWENSQVKSWLNGEFLNEYFNATERSAIIAAPIGQSLGKCADRVFLLSSEETKAYFPDNAARVACASAYTVDNGALSPGPHSWWLRSQGSYGDSFVVIVFDNGKVLDLGVSCSDSGTAVRPAIWVRR